MGDEVTAADYASCVPQWCTDTGLDCAGTAANKPTYGVAGRENDPVNCVDWFQAETYCSTQGKRLPSGAEWEWAARGGEAARLYPWGNASPTNQACWDRSNTEASCPVGSHSPAGDSLHGVRDLAGNTSEWTATKNAQGWYPVRGGNWTSQEEARLRVTHLDNQPQTHRFHSIGFRCVGDPQ